MDSTLTGAASVVGVGEAAPGPLDALVVGSVFADLIFHRIAAPGPGEETWAEGFAFTPGGVANRAVAAARLGLTTGVVSRIGTDPLSRAVRTVLELEPGLDLEWLVPMPDGQLPVTVAIANDNERSFLSYSPAGWAAVPTPTRPLPPVRLIQANLAVVGAPWIRGARQRGTVVVAGAHWDATGTWPMSHLDGLVDADIFVCNEGEAVRYTRSSSVEEAVQALGTYVPVAVVTRGAEGAIAVDASRGTIHSVPAARVTPVDPTGAGDAFLAGLMAGQSESARSGWNLETQLWLASIAASLTTGTLGGASGAPGPTEIAEYVRTHDDAGQPNQAILAWARSQESDSGVRKGDHA